MHPAVKRPKEGGIDVPSNLQGIWNRDGNATRDAVWASDIHSNINVQMNYWPVESTNLSECHLPFLNYIYNEATRPGGTWQQNAHELGAREGWVVNTAGNIFGGSSNYKRGFAHHTTAQHYDWQGGLYDNLLDAQTTSVFQIEGNFGATAGIA